MLQMADFPYLLSRAFWHFILMVASYVREPVNQVSGSSLFRMFLHDLACPFIGLAVRLLDLSHKIHAGRTLTSCVFTALIHEPRSDGLVHTRDLYSSIHTHQAAARRCNLAARLQVATENILVEKIP